MSSSTAFRLAAVALASLVLVRAFPFVWWPGTHFDSDQGIVGLMAKHISEGRAFPLYFYGQNYMLAVEAYLAAPLMWISGPTVAAVKTPLVFINIAVVVLLLRLVVRDARLHPFVAAVAVLPLALPAAGVAARVTEANGGNVEPWLYVLLIWAARGHPWRLGAVIGVGMLHREFTAYGAAALLVLDVLALGRQRLEPAAVSETTRRWTIAAVTALAIRGLAAAVQPFANGLGPGTRGDHPDLVATGMNAMNGRVCFVPETWPTRAFDLFSDHLPRIVGGTPAPLRDYGVLTGVYSGQEGLGLWVGLLTALGLVAGGVHWWRGRQSAATVGDDGGAADLPHLGGYLVLTGVLSTLVFGFAVCSNIRVETMRYNLLGVFIPVGALVMLLQTWRAPAVRAGVMAAVALWCAVNLADVAALTREYATRPPVDLRARLVEVLEERGIHISRSAFRTAYHTTFLAQERVRIAAENFSRIHAYAAEAAREQAPRLSETPCGEGPQLTPGLYLCAAGPTR